MVTVWCYLKREKQNNYVNEMVFFISGINEPLMDDGNYILWVFTWSREQFRKKSASVIFFKSQPNCTNPWGEFSSWSMKTLRVLIYPNLHEIKSCDYLLIIIYPQKFEAVFIGETIYLCAVSRVVGVLPQESASSF